MRTTQIGVGVSALDRWDKIAFREPACRTGMPKVKVLQLAGDLVVLGRLP